MTVLLNQPGWSGVKCNVHDIIWYHREELLSVQEISILTENNKEDVDSALKELVKENETPSQYIAGWN